MSKTSLFHIISLTQTGKSIFKANDRVLHQSDKVTQGLQCNHKDDFDATFRTLNCVKRVRIQSYSGPHFPAFGLNTERYSVSLRVQSECGKMWTRITPNTDTFHAVLCTLAYEHTFERSLFFEHVTLI